MRTARRHQPKAIWRKGWRQGFARLLPLLLVLGGAAVAFPQSPIAHLEYELAGTELKVSPAMVSVPKGVPVSILVQTPDAYIDDLMSRAQAMGEKAAKQQGLEPLQKPLDWLPK